MATGLVKKVIDGEEYEFSQLGAKESLRLLTRLSKIVGKPLALGFAALKNDSTNSTQNLLDKEIDKEILAKAVEALTERLDEDETLELIETLTAKDRVLCNGQKINFNSHYEGKLGHLFKVLGAALEVQYGNFFAAFPVKLGTQGISNHSTTPVQET